MKYLTLVLILFSSVSLLAAPTVEVTDLMHVKVDGIDKGTVVDAIANVPEARTAVLDWLVKWQKDQTASTDAAVAAAQAAKAERAQLIEAVVKADEAAMKAATRTEKQRRKDEAQAEFDAAKKKLEEASK